jgi:hypothetical protein
MGVFKKLDGLLDFAMMLKFLLFFSKYFLKYLQSNQMFCSPEYCNIFVGNIAIFIARVSANEFEFFS